MDSGHVQKRGCDELICWLGLIVLMLNAKPLRAAETIWHIGVFDESSSEFSTKLDYTNPAQDPVFVVGKSNPARDWSAFQPGSGNGPAGFRAHPFTIEFDLAATPKGLYTLKVALLAYGPRLPWLQVEINGHRGWLYQRPKLAYSAGDQGILYLPHYSTAQIECALPTEDLAKGKNRLVLIAMDEPGERDDALGNGFFPGNSAITYDALALLHDPGLSYQPAQTSAQVVPSIYYKSRGNGLFEMVDVYLKFGSRRKAGSATIRVGGARLSQTLASDREFGEERLEFEVPEASMGGQGEVLIQSSGHLRRFPFNASPARKWTLFLVPNMHIDVGYTDSVAKVAELHSRAVDEAMSFVDQHPAFRFNLDGSWTVDEFLKGRSEAQRNRFVQMVRDRKIFIPAPYASNFTGAESLETLIRALYYSKQFARQNQTDFNHSLLTDVPNSTWSYASVMAAAGLKYFVVGSDQWRAPFLLRNHFNEKSPQWWEGPDGGRVLTWYSRHYCQMAALFGLPPQVSAGHDALPRFMQMYDRADYKSDGVIIYGSQVENTDLWPQQAALASDWNQVYAYPKLKYAGFPDALDYIVKQMGDSVPVVRGDGGPYWEDGMLSDALLTGLTRENEQRILSAEKLSTISSLVNPAIKPDLDMIDSAWKNMLLTDEHTWGTIYSVTDPDAQESVSQAAMKAARGPDAKRQIDFILGRAFSAVQDDLNDPKGTLLVFNPLNWKRSSWVDVDLDKGARLVDLGSNQEIALDLLANGQTYQHVRFLAKDVPPVGYKCYAIRVSPAELPPAITQSGEVIDSVYYRVTLDSQTGAVRSIFDKQLNKELVDAASPYKLDQYLYVTGADEVPNRLDQYSTVSPVPKLEIHPAGQGRLVSVRMTPFGTVAMLESVGINAPRIQTEITVRDDTKCIDFVNHLQKTMVLSKEAVYFVFPLALEHPQYRWETQNGFVDPVKDLLPGAGQEWFNIQHWIAAQEGNSLVGIVPVDTPMMTVGDITRGIWPLAFGRRNGTIFSYVMNNYSNEGYPPGQGGNFTFRYALTSGPQFDAAALSRFGWEQMSPLETNQIRPNDKAVFVQRPLNAAEGSFLTLGAPNVVVDTWKLAEDGRGTIVRVHETGGVSAEIKVTSPLLQLRSAFRCNAVEDDIAPLEISGNAFTVPVKPFEIVTLRLLGESAIRRP